MLCSANLGNITSVSNHLFGLKISGCCIKNFLLHHYRERKGSEFLCLLNFFRRVTHCFVCNVAYCCWFSLFSESLSLIATKSSSQFYITEFTVVFFAAPLHFTYISVGSCGRCDAIQIVSSCQILLFIYFSITFDNLMCLINFAEFLWI